MVETRSHDDEEEQLAPLEEAETPPTREQLIAALQEIDPEKGPTEEHSRMLGLWLDEREAQADADEDKDGGRVKVQVDLADVFLQAGGYKSARRTLNEALELAQRINQSTPQSDLVVLVHNKIDELERVLEAIEAAENNSQ